MKKTLLALATIFMLAGSAIYLTACADECAKVECGAHGKCNTGTCVCDAGYETDPGNGRCDLLANAKFIGSYTAAEFDQVTGKAITVKNAAGATVDLKYDSDIAAVTGDINKVTILDLGAYLCDKSGKNVKALVPATVKGDSLLISYTDCNNTWKGAGYLNRTSKTITINYTNTYPPDPKKPGTLTTDKNKTVLTKK
jgi:EGF-like domain